MKKLILSLAFILTTTLVQAACKTALTLETDDPIYPGRGEVQLCTNSANQITKIVVIKPVQNPNVKDPNSDQADERNPVIHITIDQINNTQNEITILNPNRFGVQVKAAILEVPEKKIDPDKGGEIVLKVIKSKVLGSFHRLHLALIKDRKEWQTFLVEGQTKTPISHFYFKSGMSGIKKIETY